MCTESLTMQAFGNKIPSEGDDAPITRFRKCYYP